ncbi:nuclear RNA export factor 2-like [Meriones unguiculatus]|uniref:nuclear RNA export factor 2-like n=1 Tax=Meriones unguiculatus TaxID=10047 RepID=UPI00293EA579|nr:nuclear RNA export factor 2-like [Meriones unguiculatus]
MWSSPDEKLENRSSMFFRKNTKSDMRKQCNLSYKKSSYHAEYNMNNNRGFRGRKRGASYRWHKFHRKNDHFEDSGAPYGTMLKRRRRRSNEDQLFPSVWEYRQPKKSEIDRSAHNESRRSWFKVTIPSGRKYDKTWLMKSIQNLCSVPFIPVDFHYDRNRARFFVQDARTATALKDVSHRICDKMSRKISIFVSPSVVPYSVQNKFTSKQMEQIKVAMMKRYDASQKALNLEKLRFDQELMDNGIDMMLNRRTCMAATLLIIQSNLPELVSLNLCNNKLYQLDGLSDIVEKAPQVKILNLSGNKLKTILELEKVKELKLEELWLEGNPFCNKYSDKSDYISAVQNLFPKLLCLDGNELITPKKMKNEVPQASKDTCKGSELTKNLILQFLKEYYLFYDSGDRLSLLDAYHDEACFSLAVPFNFSDPHLNNLEEYFKHNRDIKKLKDSYMRLRLLKHTKQDIVESLRLLPKTQHDLCSFWVDLCFSTKMMLCFSVNGLFKEVEGKYQGCVRAFTRTFIATPSRNSRICIMNDELIVRNASPREIENAFNSSPAPNSSLKSPLSEEQQEMVKSFSEQSGMKLNWSQKCLEDNGWDYTKAGEIFTILQNEGKIPKEFFK